MKKYCYLNGKIIESSKAGIPLDDIGIIRGIAIFDYLRTYNGKPFRIKDYYNRFVNSAKIIGLKFKISEKGLLKILNQLMKKNGGSDCAFRLVLTGGKSSDNITIENKQNFYILVEDLPKTPLKFYKTGASIITNEYQRQFPKIKSSFYIQASKLQNLKNKKKALEILYHNKGFILECSKSNIFIVKNGKIITPKENILVGITRLCAMEIAKQENISVLERKIKLSEIWTADEVFITSSGNAKILPITVVDGKKIATGKVGPISKLMIEKFEEMTNK